MTSGPADDKVQLFIGTAKIRAGQIIKKKADTKCVFPHQFSTDGEGDGDGTENEKRAANELDLKRV